MTSRADSDIATLQAHDPKPLVLDGATAIAAAKAMGLGVCGVDMIPSERGPLVMEVNSSPGLEGIEKATGIDVAGKIMEYIAKNVNPEEPVKRRRPHKDKIGA